MVLLDIIRSVHFIIFFKAYLHGLLPSLFGTSENSVYDFWYVGMMLDPRLLGLAKSCNLELVLQSSEILWVYEGERSLAK